MDTNQLASVLPDLLVLVKVVEQGSFSAAARLLGSTPSAVSRQMARLERTLGSRLLERTTRRLRLTEAGQAAYQHSQTMLEAAQAVLDATGHYQATPQGRVRLSMPKAFGRRVIHPLMPAFLARYPQVDVQLLLDDRTLDPIADAVDLVIAATHQPPAGLVARALMPVEQWLCASPTYLARHGTPAHPQDLREHDCLYLGETPEDCRWDFQRDGQQHSVTVRGRYVVNHSDIRRDAVLQHLGIASLPHFVAAEDMRAGRMQRVLADWRCITRAYWGSAYLLYPPHRQLPPKVRVMIDYLVEEVGKLAQEAFGQTPADGQEGRECLATLPPAGSPPRLQ